MRVREHLLLGILGVLLRRTGTNYCPENTVMGGWWVADNSSYCGGPRYYMDCNATCSCTSGCGGGPAFCDTGCDGV